MQVSLSYLIGEDAMHCPSKTCITVIMCLLYLFLPDTKQAHITLSPKQVTS